MFDIGWGELLVIGVVALVVIGPKELPGVLRTIGHWTTKIRRMAGEFQNQFQEAMREAEMADLKKQVDELNDAARGLNSRFDPLDLGEARKSQPSEIGPPAAALASGEPAPLAQQSQAEASPAAATESEAEIAQAASEATPGTAEPTPGTAEAASAEAAPATTEAAPGTAETAPGPAPQERAPDPPVLAQGSGGR
jgi:sec-independent protein translocase protein TatB